MDIVGGAQLDMTLSAALESADQKRVGKLGEDRSEYQENRAGLLKAAQEFEGVFLNTLLKAMRNTVPENELFNSDGATKFYRQMHDAEMAKALASGHSGLGISDLIVQQFEARVAAADAENVQETKLDSATTSTPPLFGPTETEALDRYRKMSAVGESTAKLARLRMAARQQGTAVADTLQRYSGGIMAASRETGVEPALLLAVVMQESGGDDQAISSKGAQGLMQLMPATAAEVGVTEPANADQNLLGGARYLSRMLQRYDGRLDLALAAYNAGPGAVDAANRSIPDYPETKRYVERVSSGYRKLLGGTNLANSSP